MIFYPNAKINLFLRVTEKRKDDFHNIETLFYPIPFNDVLEIVQSADDIFSFTTIGINIGNDFQNNLVVKAYQSFKREFNIPAVKIHLHKQIPAGAGLGGGSSDAAYCLKGLNALFDKGISNSTLLAMAEDLGSDCPFFLYNKPLLGDGRGDRFSQYTVNLSGYYLVLINAGIHISTLEAYSNVIPDGSRPKVNRKIPVPVSEWENIFTNDFEKYAFIRYPILEEIKQKLLSSGAEFALMSGSGSTMFALFKEKPVLDKSLIEFKILEKQL